MEAVPSATPHILVVERDMIVGLSVAEDLLDLGFRVSGPFISRDEVMAIFATHLPDGAIVDPALRDGTGIEIARAIRESGIPLVLFSSGHAHEHRDGEFRDVPWIDKPASTDMLIAALGIGR